MPLAISSGPVMLDVTLRREDLSQRWTITAGDLPDYWSCRLLGTNTVTVSGCFTQEDVAAKVREWETEIAVAKAHGWK